MGGELNKKVCGEIEPGMFLKMIVFLFKSFLKTVIST